MHHANVEALRGEGARSFTKWLNGSTIYTAYTCHLLEGLALRNVTYICQSSACGGLPGVTYCSLSCVASCTGYPYLVLDIDIDPSVP
jgi:hypothetical protein